MNNKLTKSLSPDLIIVDEAHCIISEQYISLMQSFCDTQILGLTATPFRYDKDEKLSVCGVQFGENAVALSVLKIPPFTVAIHMSKSRLILVQGDCWRLDH